MRAHGNSKRCVCPHIYSLRGADIGLLSYVCMCPMLLHYGLNVLFLISISQNYLHIFIFSNMPKMLKTQPIIACLSTHIQLEMNVTILQITKLLIFLIPP